MTTEQKYKAIMERLGKMGEGLTPEFLSTFVILGYMDMLEKHGMIAGSYSVTPLGQNVLALCSEFEWYPTDKDIADFVNEMVNPEDRIPVTTMLLRGRDSLPEFLEEIKRFKKENE